MSFEELREKDQKYIANTYNRFPADIVRGEGASLYSESGKKYVDFGSGIAVNSFGVNDEEWKEAVIAQINRVQHASNLYYTRPQAELAAMLCERTGAKNVFFSNSGAEANECAIKAARKYSYDKYGEGRYHIVTLKKFLPRPHDGDAVRDRTGCHAPLFYALFGRVFVRRADRSERARALLEADVRRSFRARAGGGRRAPAG